MDRLRLTLKDPLFVRVPSGMRPTRRALEIEPGVRRALAEIRNMLLDGSNFDSATAEGLVRIATSDIVSFTYLPDALARLHAKAPGIDIRVRNLKKESAFLDLDAGRIDFVIGVFNDPPKRFMAREVIEDRFVVVAPPGFGSDGKCLSLERFLEAPHILFTLRDDAEGAVDDALERLGQKRRVALTTSHVLAVPALVARTRFLATISVQIAQRLGPLEGCEIFEPPIELKRWTQSLIWTAEAGENALLKYVRDEILLGPDAPKSENPPAF